MAEAPPLPIVYLSFSGELRRAGRAHCYVRTFAAPSPAANRRIIAALRAIRSRTRAPGRLIGAVRAGRRDLAEIGGA